MSISSEAIHIGSAERSVKQAGPSQTNSLSYNKLRCSIWPDLSFEAGSVAVSDGQDEPIPAKTLDGIPGHDPGIE